MSDIFSTTPWITLYGKNKLYAEGAVTLAEYTDERVLLMCKSSSLCVRGTELKVALLGFGKAVISGRINSLEFK